MKNYPNGSCPQLVDTKNRLQGWLDEHNKDLKLFTSPRHSPIKVSIYRMCWSKSDPQRAQPSTTGNQKFQYITPPSKSPKQLPNGSEPFGNITKTSGKLVNVVAYWCITRCESNSLTLSVTWQNFMTILPTFSFSITIFQSPGRSF